MNDMEIAAGQVLEDNASFEATIKARFPREVAMWEAIKHTLREDQKSFSAFMEWLGECPPGKELRAKRDGKRAPFEVRHFEWLPIGTPRRVDAALRGTTGSLQDQINELREKVEELRTEIEALKTAKSKPALFPITANKPNEGD